MDDIEFADASDFVDLQSKAQMLLKDFQNIVMNLQEVALSSSCYSELQKGLEKSSSEPLEKVLANLYLTLQNDFSLAQELFNNGRWTQLKEQLQQIRERLFFYRYVSGDAINLLRTCSHSQKKSAGAPFTNDDSNKENEMREKKRRDAYEREARDQQRREQEQAQREKVHREAFDKAQREAKQRDAENAQKEKQRREAYEKEKSRREAYEREQKQEKQARYEKEQKERKQREDYERAQKEQDAKAKQKNKSDESDDACFSIRNKFIPEKQCYAKYLDTLQATSVNERDITNCREKDNTVREIKKAYKKQSVKTHPDKSGSNELFQRVGLAYNLLMESIDRLCNGFSGGSIKSIQTKKRTFRKRSTSTSKSPTRKRSPVRTKKAHGKVLNPKTGRYVLRGGRIGSQIIADL
jgi:hypothetical protein